MSSLIPDSARAYFGNKAAQILASRDRDPRDDRSDRRRDDRNRGDRRRDDRDTDRSDRDRRRDDRDTDRSERDRRRDDDRYATRPPPPVPSQVTSTRREDDRYGPRSPISPTARDRGDRDRDRDERYDRDRGDRRESDRRPGPSSPRNSYRDERGDRSSRTAGYSSRDDDDRRRDRGDPQAGRGAQESRRSRQSASAELARQYPKMSDDEIENMQRLFKQVDLDKSGSLSEIELGKALVNGDYTTFDPHTVRMMIRMFDTDRSGTIELPEFVGLWNFLHEWRNLFNQFDEDKSGQIDYGEFHRALAKFGFKISEEYERKIFEAHDVRGRGTLSFDLFVQACISLQRIASVFKRYDTVDERGMPKGWAYFSFEQFCQEVLAMTR